MARAAGVQAIIDRQFPSGTHPYRVLKQAILDHLDPSHTVLDIGCGRRAPNLIRLRGRARVLIGLDVVEFAIRDPDLMLRTGSDWDMSGIEQNSVDLAYSQSVMEHIEDEIYRVLRPAGRYIFLTPNAWDYASLIAYLVPNRFHAKIVRWSEGRSKKDTFPTYYRANTYYSIKRMAERNGMIVSQFGYLGQYQAPSCSAARCSA